MAYDIPILFLIFNRPIETQKVFDAIKQIKPKTLFVAADGARVGRNEELLCSETRAIIQVDWDCELKLLYRDKNLGVAKAVKGAIDWLFQENERGIILEDDCLPNLSFFKFMETSLKTFEKDEDIYMVTGTNFLYRDNWGETMNYFTNYCGIWGWGTWSDRWLKYEFNVDNWGNKQIQNILNNVELSSRAKKFWYKIYQGLKLKHIHSWGYQMNFSMWNQKALCVCPTKNLIANLGMNAQGTHEFLNDPYRNNMPHEEFTNISDILIVKQIDKSRIRKIDSRIFRYYFSHSLSRVFRMFFANNIFSLLAYFIRKNFK